MFNVHEFKQVMPVKWFGKLHIFNSISLKYLEHSNTDYEYFILKKNSEEMQTLIHECGFLFILYTSKFF